MPCWAADFLCNGQIVLTLALAKRVLKSSSLQIAENLTAISITLSDRLSPPPARRRPRTHADAARASAPRAFP